MLQEIYRKITEGIDKPDFPITQDFILERIFTIGNAEPVYRIALELQNRYRDNHEIMLYPTEIYNTPLWDSPRALTSVLLRLEAPNIHETKSASLFLRLLRGEFDPIKMRQELWKYGIVTPNDDLPRVYEDLLNWKIFAENP